MRVNQRAVKITTVLICYAIAVSDLIDANDLFVYFNDKQCSGSAPILQVPASMQFKQLV